jgi:hypothetical protein
MATQRTASKKNWAVVRRLVGYDRLELPALPALEHIHDLAGDYVNFLHPVRKLVSKTREGARVRRSYETGDIVVVTRPEQLERAIVDIARRSAG